MPVTPRRLSASRALPGVLPALPAGSWGIADGELASDPDWLVWMTVGACAAGLWWLLRQGRSTPVRSEQPRRGPRD